MTERRRHATLDAQSVDLAGHSVRPREPALWAIARKDLVDRINTSTAAIVVINAPAGYGKTTTAELWCATDERPFAWVGVERADDDAVTLVRHVALALQELGPLPAPLVDALTAPGRPVETELLPAVLHELVVRGPLVLVLDDVHLLRTPRALRCLEGLVSWMPAESQVVLVGRSAPPLSLARRRLDQGVLELTSADLAMDELEAVELLDRAGVSIDRASVADLVDRTEGWPGGLHLASRILQQGGSPSRSEPLLSGTHEVVAGFLVDEVLDGLAVDLVTFLERSAIVERMSAPVLDELLEIDDSAARLDRLMGQGAAFLVPLDDRREWFRYHHLFAELLRGRLHRSDPAEERRLHDRASRLLERRRDVDGAIRHAVAAGERERASDLVLQQAVPLALGGRSDRLRAWLDLLDARDIEQYPSAAIALAWCSVADADGETLQTALRAAESSPRQSPLADGSPSAAVATAVLRATVALRGVRGVIEDTEVARRGGPPDRNPWWGVATLLQGTAFEMLGDLDRARDLVQSALPEVTGMPAYECGAQVHLAILAFYDDDLVEAERRSARSLQIVRDHHLESVLTVVPTFAVGALLGARAGRTDEADRAMAAARVLLARLGHLSPRTALISYTFLARAAIALGHFADARVFVDEAAQARRRDGSATHLSEQLDVLRGQLAEQGGDTMAEGPSLTAAELRVLVHLPTHLSLQEIADQLHISRNTAKSHAVAIYRKLGVSSRAGAVDTARRAGLLAGLALQHD